MQQHQKSHVAQVVSAGILEYEGVREAGGDPSTSLDLVVSALRDSMSETLVQLKQGLGFLATIGSTAPFVGLFGTVAGIINAFRNIAATGSGGMSVVSGGIAEALVTTALGIFGFSYLEANRATVRDVPLIVPFLTRCPRCQLGHGVHSRICVHASPVHGALPRSGFRPGVDAG